MQKQIANVVPILLGYALGLELRAALFQDWLNKREESEQGRHDGA